MGWNEFPRQKDGSFDPDYMYLLQNIADVLDMEIKVEDGAEYVFGQAKKSVNLGLFHVETMLSIEHVMFHKGTVRMVLDVSGDFSMYIKADQTGIIVLLMDMQSVDNLTKFFKELSKDFNTPTDLDKRMLSFGVKKFCKKQGEDKWVAKKVP